jgi:hypothetical protein
MQASLVAPMTTKETSKKVPFFLLLCYAASNWPKQKHGFGLVNCCMHIFLCRLGTWSPGVLLRDDNKGSCECLENYPLLMHTLSRAEDRSAAQQRWPCCTYLVLLECFRERLPCLSCLLQNLGSCLVPGPIRR